jgi:hypothetical protein
VHTQNQSGHIISDNLSVPFFYFRVVICTPRIQGHRRKVTILRVKDIIDGTGVGGADGGEPASFVDGGGVEDDGEDEAAEDEAAEEVGEDGEASGQTPDTR